MHQLGAPSQALSYTVEQRTNPYTNGEDANFGTWEQALDIGRSYLVGSSVPMGEFLRNTMAGLRPKTTGGWTRNCSGCTLWGYWMAGTWLRLLEHRATPNG